MFTFTGFLSENDQSYFCFLLVAPFQLDLRVSLTFDTCRPHVFSPSRKSNLSSNGTENSAALHRDQAAKMPQTLIQTEPYKAPSCGVRPKAQEHCRVL